MRTESVSRYRADPNLLAEQASREFRAGVRQIYGLDDTDMTPDPPSCTCLIPLSALVAEGLAGSVYAMSAILRASGYQPTTDDVGRPCVTRTHAAELMAARNEREATAEQHSRQQREINARVEAWRRERDKIVRDASDVARRKGDGSPLASQKATLHGSDVGRDFERNCPPEIRKRIHPRYFRSWADADSKIKKIKELVKL